MIRNYFLRHAQVFFYSLGQLAHTPVTTLMTLLVIAITLVLPGGLYLTVDNLQQLGGQLGQSTRITLFLKKDLSQDKTHILLDYLKRDNDVAQLEYLSPKQALEDFKSLSGFSGVIDHLPDNPLPGVVRVVPDGRITDPRELDTLTNRLGQLKAVDFAQLDTKWIQRLHALLDLAERVVGLLAMLLASGVLLIIGNTIRLSVLNRRREIEIIKLVGGTDAFIRRPFLYNGTLQGLLGAVLAISILYMILWALSGPVSELNALYGGRFQLQGPGARGSGILLLAGALLGWVGARLSVGRHLAEIEPE